MTLPAPYEIGSPHDAFDVIMPIARCCVAEGLELGCITIPTGFGASLQAGGERHPTHPRPCFHALYAFLCLVSP